MAIGAKHDEAGCVDPTNHPTVATTLAGIRNALDEVPLESHPLLVTHCVASFRIFRTIWWASAI